MRALRVDQSFVILALVLIICVGLWIQLALINKETEIEFSADHNQPDYFIRNFVASGQEAEGDAYILMGDYLEYFSDDRVIDIQRPCLLISQEGDPPKLIFGNEGTVIENGTVVILRGKVQIIERLAQTTDLPSRYSRSLLEKWCFSSNWANGGQTRTEELTLQLTPRLNY